MQLSHLIRNGLVFVGGVLVGTGLSYFGAKLRQTPELSFDALREQCQTQCRSGGQLGVDMACLGACLHDAVVRICREYNDWARSAGEPLMECGSDSDR